MNAAVLRSFPVVVPWPRALGQAERFLVKVLCSAQPGGCGGG